MFNIMIIIEGEEYCSEYDYFCLGDRCNVVLLQCGLSPFTLNTFQFNLEFGTTHRVG